MAAEAPSLIEEVFPAVTVPLFLSNEGRSATNFSTEN